MAELEKRNNISLSISGEADYRIAGSIAPPVTVYFSEISTAGIHFVTAQELPKVCNLNLSIRLSALTNPILAEGSVLWQRQISSKFLFRTCVKFTKVQEDQEGQLLQYIREYSKWRIVDREHVRCGLNTDVSCVSIGSQFFEATCLSADIGLKGMKLLTDAPWEPGQKIQIVFSLPHVIGTVECTAQVAWKRPGVNCCVGISFEELSTDQKDKIQLYINETLLRRKE